MVGGVVFPFLSLLILRLFLPPAPPPLQAYVPNQVTSLFAGGGNLTSVARRAAAGGGGVLLPAALPGSAWARANCGLLVLRLEQAEAWPAKVRAGRRATGRLWLRGAQARTRARAFVRGRLGC